MKKLGFTTIMMGMCMWTQLMCMTFCALISDMFSVSEINTQAT